MLKFPAIFSAVGGVILMALPQTGWITPTYAKWIFWGGVASLIFGGFWAVAPIARGRLSVGLIPLPEAAMAAYPKLKSASRVWAVENLPSFDRSKLPGQMAHLLIDESVTVFGKYFPSTELAPVAHSHKLEYGITDDAAEMFDRFKPVNRYTDLKIRRSDMRRRIKEIAKEDLSRN